MNTTATKERPILFSAPMVRAILAGHKTQTRRIVNPQPESLKPLGRNGAPWPYVAGKEVPDMPGVRIQEPVRCPFGGPDDRLWVRETWAPSDEPENHDNAKDGFTYRADWDEWDDVDRGFNWKPSIHMPRRASRITLEVVSVRVERLQKIDDWGAVAEGIDDPEWHKSYGNSDGDFLEPEGIAVEAYRDVWESIYGPESWASNPWVWVVKFKRIEANK